MCNDQDNERRCPEDPDRTVVEVFAEERLLPLPAASFPSDAVCAVSAGKTPYVRFDRNDDSIPHDGVARALTVSASLDSVRLLDGQSVVARLRRSFDRGAQIEDPAHVADLVEAKRAARAHRGADRLVTAIPLCRDFLAQADRTPEQALAVIELLDDRRERIWAHYQLAIVSLMRGERRADENFHDIHAPPF